MGNSACFRCYASHGKPNFPLRLSYAQELLVVQDVSDLSVSHIVPGVVEPDLLDESKSFFGPEVQPARGVCSRFHGVSREGCDWVLCLQKFGEERCGGVVLSVTGLCEPRKRVASDAKVRRAVHGGHGGVIPQIGSEPERCSH